MKLFIDIIAQCYLLHTKNNGTEIAQFFFQQYNKVKEGSGSKTIFSKNQFYNTLMSEIDSLIKDTYASKNKNNSAYEDSILYRNKVDREVREHADYIDECHLYGYEYVRPIQYNWDKCSDAEKLSYAIENKGIILANPIVIVQPCESISPEPLVLRKKNLLILKKEAKRAELANSIEDLDFNNSDEEKTSQTLINQEHISHKKDTVKIIKDYFNDSHEGWQYAFKEEKDYNDFVKLLALHLEQKRITLPENTFKLNKRTKTRVAEVLKRIHFKLSLVDPLRKDTPFFNIIKTLSEFSDMNDGQIYKALTK